MPEKIYGKDGFTLIEVMITVLILSIALWALSSLQTVSVATNYTSSRMTVATLLAQDKLEDLKGLPWDDPQLADTSNNFTVDLDENGTADYFDWNLPTDHTNADSPGAVPNPIDANGNPVANPLVTAGYTRTWNIADSAPGTNMKTISVRVRWQEKRGKLVTMDTVISRN